MAAGKRKQLSMQEQVREREVADRVARAKASSPKWDDSGVYLPKLRELADQSGRDVGDLLDDWTEASGIRMYDANMTVEEAERLAFADVRDRVIAQRRLAV